MWRRIISKENLSVSIIACGDAGQKIGVRVIEQLKKKKTKLKSLLVSSGSIETLKQDKNFKYHFSVDPNYDGFAKKLDIAIEKVKKYKDDLRNVIKNIIPSNPEDLLIVITGPGATGIASTMLSLDIIYEDYRIIPPVFTLLPEVFENSRVQYNSAMFLYNMLYKPNSRENSIILIDNKPKLNEMDNPFKEVSELRLDTIPIGIADILYGSFIKSLSSTFEASTSDLYDVLHTPGISVFVVEDLQTESGNKNTRLQDIIADSVVANTSLPRDAVFEAKSSFILITNLLKSEEQLSLQTGFETKKLFKEFSSRPFVKFIRSIDEGDTIPRLYGIIAGLPIPTRVLQIMKIARDSRKKIINSEKELSQISNDFNIDHILELRENYLRNFK